VEIGMTKADFSGAKLQPPGAIILVAWLEQKAQHTTLKLLLTQTNYVL
jgi:hypothetical protein